MGALAIKKETKIYIKIKSIYTGNEASSIQCFDTVGWEKGRASGL